MLPAGYADEAEMAQWKDRLTRLRCDRLECGLLVRDEEAGIGRGEQPTVRLNWLLASGSAELRDRQDDTIFSIHARQIDFNREVGQIRVLGTPRTNARVYQENPATSEMRTLVGEEFIVNLESGTVRSGATRGEFIE
jgi:hypothetical protein